MPRRTITAVCAAALLAAGLASAPAAAAPQLWQERWAEFTGWDRHSSPVIADIDNDGRNEVVFGHQDGYLRAFEDDGTLKWATAAVPGRDPACNAQGSPSSIDSSPAVADLDRDGRMEIVVGVGSNWTPNQNGSVIAFDGVTGAIEWRTDDSRDIADIWSGSPTLDGWCEATFATPAIGDVDGDGYDDVVFGSWDFYIWAVDRFGQPLPGFPFNNDDTVWSSPALFDVDGDGRQEIFIGGDSTPGGYFDHLGGVFRALDWSGGVVTELWNRTPDEVVHGSAAIADINGDGRAEAIVSTGEYWHVSCARGSDPYCRPGVGTDHNKIFAFHVDDGSTVPGFPLSTGDTVLSSPAVGDLDGDGDLEIVVGSFDEYVRAWHHDGSLMWARKTTHGHPALGPSAITGSPIIADLDGDGDQDVAVGSRTGMSMLDGRTGISLEEGLDWQFRIGVGWSFENAPAVGVLGGQRQIVWVGFDQPKNLTRIAAFPLGGSTATVDDWPMWRRTPDRRGATVRGLCELSGSTGTFCDVPDTAWYNESVEWMVAQGITNGVSPTQFGPLQQLTRAQMITFLWRQVGQPTGYPDPGFVDVDPGGYYADAVAWAKATGVTTGTSAITFSPGQVVTRGQLVTLLWRRAGRPGGHPNPGFSDVPVGQYFTVPVWWAKAVGVTNGTSSSTFSPDDPVTRAQAAALVYREAMLP